MVFGLVQWPPSLWTTMHQGKLGVAAVGGLVALGGGIVGTAILVVTLASLHGIRKRRADARQPDFRGRLDGTAVAAARPGD
jgi:hypothetical protein